MKKTFLNRLKNFMMKMMLSCKQASYLIDKKEYIDLNAKEKINLKMHLSTCKYCRNYEKDSILISKIISRTLNINDLELILSDEQKQRLNEKLKNLT